MKRIILSLHFLFAASSVIFAVGPDGKDRFAEADHLFAESEFISCRNVLDSLLKASNNQQEKAEVQWRLARLCHSTKEYSKGVSYAASSISADPTNASAYMWHCVCSGWESYDKSVVDKAKAVTTMFKDLEIILNKLGRTDYSEAWKALGEIYFNHPFKSNDSAANFLRQAVATVPPCELKLSFSILLAEILNSRGWSAERKVAAAKANASLYANAKTNIEKYSYLDGKPGNQLSISDKQEAQLVLQRAKQRYDNKSHHTKVEKAEYQELLTILK